jgi:hypothetical protein
MAKLPPIVADYIAAQPEAAQPALQEIHGIISKAFPKAKLELYSTGAGALPIYKDGETWVGGFSLRKSGPMVYVMDQDIVAKYKPQLGLLATGKACVNYKPTKTLNAAAVKALFTQMFAEAAAKKK